jgi:hypothetical protein
LELGGSRGGMPSNLTKENYAKYLLSAKSFAIIFVNDESL